MGGTSDTTVVNGVYNTTDVTGTADYTVINGNSNTTNVRGTSDATDVNGNSNTTTIYGASDTTNIFGSNNNTNVIGTNDNTYIQGSYNITRISGYGDFTRVTGFWNNTYVTGNNDNTDIEGYRNYIEQRKAGNALWVAPNAYNWRVYTPVILDLNQNGLDLIELNNSTASFDYEKTGTRNHTAWVGGEDGLLVIDINNDGNINEAKELSFASWDPTAKTDLEGLRLAFDSNHDGIFDAQDARWSEFRVWQDQNQNGISETGELHSLAELDIVSLNLTSDGVVRNYSDGSILYGTTSFTRGNGTIAAAGDFGFAYDVTDKEKPPYDSWSDAHYIISPSYGGDLNNEFSRLGLQPAVAHPDTSLMSDYREFLDTQANSVISFGISTTNADLKFATDPAGNQR